MTTALAFAVLCLIVGQFAYAIRKAWPALTRRERLLCAVFLAVLMTAPPVTLVAYNVTGIIRERDSAP